MTVREIHVTPCVRRYSSLESKRINGDNHWLIVYAKAETSRSENLATEKLWTGVRDFSSAPKGRLGDSRSWKLFEVTLNRRNGELLFFISTNIVGLEYQQKVSRVLQLLISCFVVCRPLFIPVSSSQYSFRKVAVLRDFLDLHWKYN